MEDTREILPAIVAARNQFMELVDVLRPELHRYCARMTGSVFDGEDVVQDALAKAYFALGQMMEPPNLKPWIFRIAHNTAMDHLKRYDRKNVDSVAEVSDRPEPEDPGVDPDLVEAALAVFAELPPLQRSALILKDVLGHSLEEIAAAMGTTVGGVKAALSRARANIARVPRASIASVPVTAAAESQTLQRYVELFNDRNWDGLRALLAEEARLDLVSRWQRTVAAAGYYDRYAEMMKTEDFRAKAGFVDGTPAIAIFGSASATEPQYFIVLDSSGGRISRIRDFRYVRYIAADARFTSF